MEEEGAGNGGRPDLPAAGGADLINALPEDLLVQVIRRLRCARAAARTSILSRPWRGLWRRLADLTFRDMVLDSLQAAVNSLAARPDGYFLLDIRVPRREGIFSDILDSDEVSSLLHALVRLSPVELRFDARLKSNLTSMVKVNMPQFSRTTSMELHGLDLRFPVPDSFPALERLALSSCSVDLAYLVLRCQRLRVLSVAFLCNANILIRSASLQELVLVESQCKWIYCIDIQAPLLSNLTLSFGADRELRVCILAPMVENLSWLCTYPTEILGLGPWRLSQVKLETADSSVLGLWMDSFAEFRCTHTEPSLAKVIEKHLLADFSVLHLHLSTMGQAFGAFVSYLLGIRRIRTSTRSLKIALQRFMMSPKCREYCPCDVPKNWRSQTISLINLEEVEMEGFEGEDHEIDLLKLIFQCAPLLKRMTVYLSEEITTSNSKCTEILDIFNAYPFVECNVRTHGPAKVVSQQEPHKQHLQVDERRTVDQKVPM